MNERQLRALGICSSNDSFWANAPRLLACGQTHFRPHRDRQAPLETDSSFSIIDG